MVENSSDEVFLNVDERLNLMENSMQRIIDAISIESARNIVKRNLLLK